MSRTRTYLGMGRPKICCTKVELCIRLGEKFWQSYFGAVMTSSKSRKTSKNHKNHNFSEFSQLWAPVSRFCFKDWCFPLILSISTMGNSPSGLIPGMREWHAQPNVPKLGQIDVEKAIFWLNPESKVSYAAHSHTLSSNKIIWWRSRELCQFPMSAR